jgi:Ni2+-binding GTPase involved in maturation of urease and hydrogenase
MIVQVCGTNGSGKTTALRAVIAQMRELSTLVVEGKEYGKTYHLQEDEEREDTPPLVLVMGRYGEAATGGCDRISDVKSIRPVIAEQAALGFHVVFEGIRMVNHTDGAEFCARYVREGGTYHVVLLTTTLEECL